MRNSASPREKTAARPALLADTAADLMTAPAVSLPDTAIIPQAVALLIEKGFHAAPVIDAAGRPVGVLSTTDILLYAGQKSDRLPVREIMTPAVFSVTPDTPASKVVDEFLALKLHQLFVVDQTGVLIGVISTLDVLRRLGNTARS
jgi:CBS domain-containing protein